MSLDEFLEEWNNPSPYVHVQTSGSTGAPKPMLVEKQRMLNSARITCDFLGLREGDTALLCMSLDYIAGKMMVVRSIERGLKLITVEPSGHPLYHDGVCSFASNDAKEQIPNNNPLPSMGRGKGWGVNFAAMVPMQVYNSLQVPDEKERLMRIRHLIIGGGAIDDALASALRTFPNHVWSTYGMTETLSHIALRRLNGPEASEWYTPFPSVKVSLNEDSCLVIDAPLVCPSRLVTNDIAELSSGTVPNMKFRILGRKDNVICSGGIKIQIETVERQLRPHLQAPFLITKRPDAKFGEAVVLLTEGAVDEGRRVCAQVLPKYNQPKAYLHVDKIPLTATGKPARKEAENIAKSR